MEIFTILLTQPLTNGLILFYRLLWGNMGLAIIAFSVALRLLLHPLTKPYMESMKKMKKYSAEIEKLKKKHKGDRKKLMQAQSDFYKQKGINPGAGCLPYLLQIVVLIALFRVFSKVLTANGDIVVKLNELLYAPLSFSGDTSLNTSFLYLDITKPDVFNLAGLPFSLPGAFVVAAALVQFVSAKMISPYVEEEKKMAKKTVKKEDDMAVAMQSSMIYTFPLMTLFIGMRFPSGLALYWLSFSVFQMIVQYRSTGWGGLTPWIRRLSGVKLRSYNK